VRLNGNMQRIVAACRREKEIVAGPAKPRLCSAPVSASTPASSRIRPYLLVANYSAPVVLIATQFRHPWLIAGALCIHACFFYAVVAPGCGWLGPVATRFSPQGSEVWLTIDDGPAGDASLRLSEEMVRRGVRATFFVKGENLARQPEVGRALLAAGHTLANHTQTHPAHIFWWLRPTRLRAEIDACNDALRSAGVAALRWFRSPVGLKNVFLQPALARRDMRFVGWSVRGHDGVSCDPEAVARRVGAGVSPGAIVLLHEGRPRSNEAILRVIDELTARGYSFVIPGDDQLV
jgi:peptidoglycan/xylan/chitin deacetylase (PgdA/CDA1 family)